MAPDYRADKSGILNFIFAEFADRIKCRPRDDKLFSFFLFMKNNTDVVWQVISRAFATRYPPISENTAESDVDELCYLIGTLPSVIRTRIEKSHREIKAKHMRKVSKEIKVMSFILSKEEYKPSMIAKIAQEKPKTKCSNWYCGTFCFYSDPNKRLALKAVTQYYNAVPRLWPPVYKKKNIFF